ncbi:MAG: hypothetical protein M4D80_01735 [Myxococcota bacterium]|nr:hypothetical protein [Deltaproteobacteria bacterium]MDQ3333877.1 hypothetical protein [Myxococcota bacterium]
MKGRWIIVALALAAACAFAFSVQLGRWWAIGDVEIGPYGSRHCFGVGPCKMADLDWVGGGDRWMRLGMATWAGGLVATFMLVVMSARLAANKVPKLVAKSVLVAIATASLAGTVFVATFPGLQGASLARGAWLFAIGVVLALVAAIRVLRSNPAARG